MSINELSLYGLRDLLTLGEREGIIDGYERIGDTLVVHLEGERIYLSPERELGFLRALVRAWVLGGGKLPPLS